MRKIVILIAVVVALSIAVVPSLAAPNPSGTGQPSQSCEQLSGSPAGFATSGFAHAKTVYANIDGTKRVSQYDVACFQLSPH
jgi:hypothetical protein